MKKGKKPKCFMRIIGQNNDLKYNILMENAKETVLSIGDVLPPLGPSDVPLMLADHPDIKIVGRAAKVKFSRLK